MKISSSTLGKPAINSTKENRCAMGLASIPLSRDFESNIIASDTDFTAKTYCIVEISELNLSDLLLVIFLYLFGIAGMCIGIIKIDWIYSILGFLSIIVATLHRVRAK